MLVVDKAVVRWKCAKCKWATGSRTSKNCGHFITAMKSGLPSDKKKWTSSYSLPKHCTIPTTIEVCAGRIYKFGHHCEGKHNQIQNACLGTVPCTSIPKSLFKSSQCYNNKNKKWGKLAKENKHEATYCRHCTRNSKIHCNWKECCLHSKCEENRLKWE